MNTYVFTCGDINGIGPEICIKTINKIFKRKNQKIIFLCPANVFESTSSFTVPDFQYDILDRVISNHDENRVLIVDMGSCKQSLGKPTKVSGEIAYQALIEAYRLNMEGIGDAMITAPVSKTGFNLAGRHYPGQTELLAKLSKTNDYMMMFLSGTMICGLTTIHESIKRVPKILTKELIINAIKILNKTLINDLGKESGTIALLGLNPHAGENGAIGDEEIRLIEPAMKSVKGISCRGPFVPDAFFGNKRYREFDAVLGMYHDQVLIPFKMLNFNSGVNFTAGLPVIRTSPDHGTGYDIAGKGIANPASMIEAVGWAGKIITNRRKKQVAG